MSDPDAGLQGEVRLSRRAALKSMGVLGITPLVAPGGVPTAEGPLSVGEVQPRGNGVGEVGDQEEGHPGRNLRNDAPSLHRIRAGRMLVDFDADLGTVHSISVGGDPLGTNFVGNQLNTRGVDLGDPHWTGDLVATVWDPSPPSAGGVRTTRWRRETTLDSDDIRRVTAGPGTFQVTYRGSPGKAGGLRSFDLASSWHADADGSLRWDLELANTTGRTLEVGEIALPLRANDDYGIVYRNPPPEVETLGRTTAIQKVIHEQKMLAHFFAGGHSGYALLQRPSGDGPFLLIRCEEDTSIECIHKVEGRFAGDWIGTDLLAIHSWGTHQVRGWHWNPWVNGHTSLVLGPGERKRYRFRLSFINDYPEIRESLVKSGNLGVRVVPGMVVRGGTEVKAEVKSSADLDGIEIHADGVEIKERRRAGGATLLTLVFTGRGQKSIRLLYGAGRWTNLHFFAVEDPEELIKARARFMVQRQYYENPADPFNRNHVFLPFDYRQARMIDDYPDVWEVGGTGDPGFGDPLFLAAKNVVYPDRTEIATLEEYVDDCLFRHIQDPRTFLVRRSLYWKERYPSSPGSSYSKERSEDTDRAYNYCFVANIYHAMYRLGKAYDVLESRTPQEYLRMSFETCRRWFTAESYHNWGLMTGSNAVEILTDLEAEGWSQEARELLGLISRCNDEFIRDPYPYASEIEIDETGQHQVYFFTRFFRDRGDAASRAKNDEVVRVIKALRGGDQPMWFLYGNDLFAHPDLRGQLSCWHSEVLNGLPLLTYYEETGDPVALMKGYPGVTSVLRCVQADGMGFAWFFYAPGVFGFEPPRTFEGGIGLWGYLQTARSYVVDDPSFGLTGYGCRVEEGREGVSVVPLDGVKKRVRWMREGVAVDLRSGEIARAVLAPGGAALTLEMADSTGLVATAGLTVRGLLSGVWDVTHGGGVERRNVDGTLKLDVPMEVASVIQLRRV